MRTLLVFATLMLTACGAPVGNSPTNPEDSRESTSLPTPVPLPSPEMNQQLLSEFIPQVNKDRSDNRFSTALFGIAREMISIKETIKFETLKIKTPYLKGGPLAVYIHRSPKGRAPLAIVMNPLYSGDFQDQMLRFKEFYARRGYHVIAFANPWSPEFLENGPAFFPGDIWTEGQMHLELMNQLVDEVFGRENVSGATLIGMSYGAFLGSVLKAYDQMSDRPLINGPTVLLNPPHDIMHSLRTIDRQTAEVRALDAVKCLVNGGFLGVLRDALKIEDYNETSMKEACSKYLLTTVGFDLTLKYSVATLNKSKKLGLSLKQIADVTYEGYVREIAKLNPSPRDTNMGHWMNEARVRGYDGFLVVISRDDSINEGNDLSANPYFAFSARNLITLPTGGHTGFREAKSTNPACPRDWTSCLLNAIYP